METSVHPTPIRVFLIEDDGYYRGAVRDAVHLATNQILVVGEAGNAAQGLREIRSLSPDLVVVDLRLPHNTDDGQTNPDFGIAVIKVIADRRSDGRPSILALSHYQDDQPDLVARAVRAGADSYIVKGYKSSRKGAYLAEVMLSLAEGKQIWGPEIASIAQEYKQMRTLSPRERQIHALLKQELTDQEIAYKLGTAVSTVKKQMTSILVKTGTKSRHEAKRITVSDEFDLFGLDKV